MSKSKSPTTPTQREGSITPTAEQMAADLAAEGIRIDTVLGGFAIRYDDACALDDEERRRFEERMLEVWPDVLEQVLDQALGRTHPAWCSQDHCTAYVESEGADGMHWSSFGDDAGFRAYRAGSRELTDFLVTLEQGNQPGSEVLVDIGGKVMTPFVARSVHAYLGRLLEQVE